jgi:hypothetical protein
MRKLLSFRPKRRVPAVLALLAVTGLATAAIAFADIIIADGDGVAFNDSNMTFSGTIACDEDSTTQDALIKIRRNGSYGAAAVFQNGTNVTVDVESITGDDASDVTATFAGTGASSDTVTLPSTWDSAGTNSFAADSVTSNVTIHPTSSGDGSATITYRATGTASNDTPTTDSVRIITDTMTVSWTAGSCVPPNAAPSVPGAPGLASGSSTPNQGVFGLTWTASTDDGLPTGSTVSYQLQHQDANDAGYSDVSGATALTLNAFAFTSGSRESEGTWTYKVRASDGSLQSAYSGASAGVKVDRSAPTAPTASTTPASPDFGDWFKDSVTVSYSGSTDPNLVDGSAGSGVAGYTANETFNTSGSHNYSGKATDNAGNESTATTGSVKVDTKAPEVTLTCPGAVKVGSTASAGWVATDAGESGINGAASGSIAITALDTSTIGTKTATAPAGTAEDNVGHKSLTATCQYTVEYDFSGFYQPIDMNGVFNKAKAGSAIPVKFSLDGAPQPGSNTPGLAGSTSGPFMPGTPTSPNPTVTTLACPATPTVDTIEELATDSTSGLKYDPTADQWIYVWKTTTGLANSCRQLKVVLADGTTKTANFQFTK